MYPPTYMALTVYAYDDVVVFSENNYFVFVFQKLCINKNKRKEYK